MWVTKHLKCPDEGVRYQLISVTDEGEAKVEAYLSKEEAQKFIVRDRLQAVRGLLDIEPEEGL